MSRIRSLFASWFESLENLGMGWMIFALVLVGIGSLTDAEIFNRLGLACFGAAVIAWGANTVMTRELTLFQRGIRVSAQVEELVARAWGLVLLLGGVALLGYQILTLLNPRAPVPLWVQQFFATPQGAGVLQLALASVGILFALTFMLASDAEGSNAIVRFLLSLPGRVSGLVLFVIFAVMAVSALIQIFAPGLWQEIVQSFMNRLGF
jgi:hypothetical protein